MAGSRVYLLGGAQTDFARNFAREGREIFDVIREVALAALENTGVAPEEIDTAHVGNFTAELQARLARARELLADGPIDAERLMAMTRDPDAICQRARAP